MESTESAGARDEAPSDPAPTDPAPTDPAPTDPAPSDPAPSDPAPTDPANGQSGAEAPSVEGALLTVADLPAGWSQIESDGEGTGNCLDDLTGDDSAFGGPDAATASFSASALGPFVVVAVTPVPAQAALPDLDGHVVACDGATGPDGLTTTIEAVAIDGVPGGSLTVRGAQADPAGGSVQFAIAATGGANGTALVLALSPAERVDDELVARSLVTMADRLASS